MIVELGHFALILAMMIALGQSVVGLAGPTMAPQWINRTPAFALAQAVLVAFVFFALMYAYAVSDFSVQNVFVNSHTWKPMIYKLSGVWGNHEGSMVLWVLILAAFGALVALFGGNLPGDFRARVLGVQGLIGVVFLAFIAFTSNPFTRLIDPPPNGQGLNPVLQDPGLASHPPFLYVGYVGLSVTFSFAIAALIQGRVNAAWAMWVRPWALAAWAALTIGIALGSYWAYYELGWGGWWFWDPVENASLMPWLAATALLHSAIVMEKRGTLKSWTVLLAIIAFSFSLLGTFLVRSGVLTSVHAFAVDPARGMFVLMILCLFVGGSFALYAWRAPKLQPDGPFGVSSREAFLLVNNLLLSVATATVLLGTLYPLILEALTGDQGSVGAFYFNITFGPLMALLCLAVPMGPVTPWKRGDLAETLRRLSIAGLLTVIVTAILLTLTGGAWAVLGLGLGTWLVFGAATDLLRKAKPASAKLFSTQTRNRLFNLPRAAFGTAIAHAGLGLMVIGITGISAWRVEEIAAVTLGDSLTVSGYEFRFDDIEAALGPNYTTKRATLTVIKNGKPVATLHPEKRYYPVEDTTTTEAGIHPGLLRDLYAVLGEPQSQVPDASGELPQTWALRIYINPLVTWIWMGALVMALGGVVSLSDRRLRLGAPARSKPKSQPASGTQPAAAE